MTEEQAEKFMAMQKMILQRVSWSATILIVFAAVAGLILVAAILFAVFA